MIEIIKAKDYHDWFNSLTQKDQFKVDARITRIEKHEHFGDAKYLNHGLSELRWKNGWRVYFSIISIKKLYLY